MTRYIYTFFDQTVILSLPRDLQKKWDHLYGRFYTPSVSSANAVSITWEPKGAAYGRLSLGPQSRDVAMRDIMMHLQDFVQNTILPSVRSHLLWHGAVWHVDGHGIILLGASGLGKTTLSLAELMDGGQVLSDEIAAWDPVMSTLVAFPRALAVRPDTLALLGDRRPHVRLHIDEEKALIPLAPVDETVPLKAVCILEWPMDTAIGDRETVCEFQVVAANEQWVVRLREVVSAIVLQPHPDGGNWWRCHTPNPLRLDRLEQVLQDEHATLMEWHRGARRRPNFSDDPQVMPLNCDTAAGLSMAWLINARTWVDEHGAPRVLGMVRAALRNACCYLCVPGKIAATRRAVYDLDRTS